MADRLTLMLCIGRKYPKQLEREIPSTILSMCNVSVNKLSPMDQIRYAVSKEDTSSFEWFLWGVLSFENVDKIISIAPDYFRVITKVLFTRTLTDYSAMTQYIKSYGKRANGVKYYNGLNKQVYYEYEVDGKCMYCGKWLVEDYPLYERDYAYCCHKLDEVLSKWEQYTSDCKNIQPYIEHLRKKKDNVKLNALCKLLIFSGLSHVVALSIGDSIQKVNREKVCFL